MSGRDSLRIAIVSRDPLVRLEAARAFDAAPPTWLISLHDSMPDDADVVVVGSDVPSDGNAIVFDSDHPARSFEAVARRSSRRGEVIAVTGAGGGTGATTVSLHLAAECARSARVCFVDLDTAWGAGDRLGAPSGVKTWADAADPESMRLAALLFPGRLRALLAPHDGPVDLAIDVLDRAVAEFDRLIVDVPVGDLLAPVVERARVAVMVVPPTTTAAQRARQLLVRHPSAQWAVVTNRLGPGGETTRAALERILLHRVALELPCTPALRDAEDRGELLGSKLTRWARGIGRLAAGLERG